MELVFVGDPRLIDKDYCSRLFLFLFSCFQCFDKCPFEMQAGKIDVDIPFHLLLQTMVK